MRIWTFQPLDAINQINNTGEYVCDKKKLKSNFSSEEDYNEWIKSYKWLIEQMRGKIRNSPQDTFPIWGWHTRNFKHKKPDFRESIYGNRGEKYACFELEIPDSEVLLSDYDAWHWVLNNCYYNHNCISEEQFLKDEEMLKELDNKKKQKTVEDSWQGIFDIEPFENNYTAKGKYVQATFWKIKKEYIKNVYIYKAK